MKKFDLSSAAELFSGIPPLESVKPFLSLFVSFSEEEAKGRRTLVMYDLSRAHFHGVPVRRVFVKTPDEVRHAREKGHNLNTLACRASACRAQWTPVLVGKRITRRS